MSSTGASFVQVLEKDQSLQRWIFSKYKKLTNLSFSNTASEIKLALERIIQSFGEVMSVGDSMVDSDEDESDHEFTLKDRQEVSLKHMLVFLIGPN